MKVNEEGNVHVYTGRSIEREDGEGERSHSANLFEHKGMVKARGEPHTEELTGPEGERVVLYVRNIGASAVNPYVAELPFDVPFVISCN